MPRFGEPRHFQQQRSLDNFSRGALQVVEDLRGLIKRLEEKALDLSEEQQNEGTELESELDDKLPLFRARVFERDLTELVAAARQLEEPLALIVIDLDKFKFVNDSHGHQIGDEVLRDVGTGLKKIVGGRGRCYRYGGEELGVLLPNFSSDEATVLAERIRKHFEASSFSSKALQVTASFGVAEFPTHSATGSELLKRADEAMFEAKGFGRNLVRLYGEERPSAPEPRVAPRKQPDASVLTEAQSQKIRMEYFGNLTPTCPRCVSGLRVQEFHFDEKVTPDLNVTCPMCGLFEEIPGPA
jgi:diguanylate cyclase (GGDEF)-like protein